MWFLGSLEAEMDSEGGLCVVWPQRPSSTKRLEGLVPGVPGLRGRQLSWGLLAWCSENSPGEGQGNLAC